MTLDEKRNVINENKEITVAALNSVIDTYLNFNAPITNEKGNIMTSLFRDQKTENFALSVQDDIKYYETIK